MELSSYLFLSVCMLVLGIAMVISRRNLIYVLMGLELILNAANINLAAFARFNTNPESMIAGQMFVIFVIILAVAEAAIALAIVLNIFGLFDSVRPEDPDFLRE